MKTVLYTEEQAYALEKKAKGWIAFCIVVLVLMLASSIPLCFGVTPENGTIRGVCFGGIWAILGLTDIYAFFEGILGNIEKGRFILRCSSRKPDVLTGTMEIKEFTTTVSHGICLFQAEIHGKEGKRPVLVDPSRLPVMDPKKVYSFETVEGVVVSLMEEEA